MLPTCVYTLGRCLSCKRFSFLLRLWCRRLPFLSDAPSSLLHLQTFYQRILLLGNCISDTSTMFPSSWQYRFYYPKKILLNFLTLFSSLLLRSRPPLRWASSQLIQTYLFRNEIDQRSEWIFIDRQLTSVKITHITPHTGSVNNLVLSRYIILIIF